MEPNPIVNQQESLKGSNGQSGKMIALTFAAGGLLGTAVGMLLAPWKGSEAREMIAGMAGDLKEKTNGLSSGWQEKARHWLKQEKDQQQIAETAGRADPVKGVEGQCILMDNEPARPCE
jgi:gas vesicle protein